MEARPMKANWFVGFAAVIGLMSGAGHVSAEGANTIKVAVGDVSLQSQKVRVMFVGAGQQAGVMPGDKGYFLKDGTKIASDGDFEIFKITDRGAFAISAFTAVDAIRFRTS